MLLDVRGIPMSRRLAAADAVRTAHDVTLPDLAHFNSRPCARHASIEAGAAAFPPCHGCGIRLRRHQRVGVTWLYLRGRGLIADQVGTGKTAHAAGLLAILKQTGELREARAVVVARSAGVCQWVDELARFVPDLRVIAATGTPQQRIEKYLSGWEVCVTGWHTFVNDLHRFEHFTVRLLVIDDVDPLRTRSTRTAWALKRMARRCERVAVLTASAIQKRLHEMHSILEPVGGLAVLGSESAFRRQFVREERVRLYSGSAGRMVLTRRVTGYQNIERFVELVRPLTLRRTPADIDDVELPAIVPNVVYLQLHPEQARRYAELRRGVLRIIRSHATTVKHATAAAAFTYGQQICAGLATLGEPDGPGASVKLDWCADRLIDGDLCEEKVVVFAYFQATIRALSARLAAGGVGHEIIWGAEPNKERRHGAQTRFWNDPACRVLVGSTAIEQSLNLQVARHLICVDQIMNAARMQQVAGRIRRDGSPYKSVWVHSLLTRGTQEEGYLELLGREQALADYVWGEANELFAALSPLALLQLIGTTRRTA